jgi:hypothetical protein
MARYMFAPHDEIDSSTEYAFYFYISPVTTFGTTLATYSTFLDNMGAFAEEPQASAKAYFVSIGSCYLLCV